MSLPKPYYDQDGITIYHGDCRDVLPNLPRGGQIITDPPYNLGKQYGEHDDNMTRATYEAWMIEWLRAATAVGDDGVVFSYGKRWLGSIDDVLRNAGLRQIRYLAWHRLDYAGDKWHGGPAECWEPIVWASQAETPHFNKVFGSLGRDCIAVASVRTGPFRDKHPCPKPERVALWLVRLFGLEGSPIIDPFAGTGTFLEAAKSHEYTAIGIEIEERYCEIAARRLAQGVFDFGSVS